MPGDRQQNVLGTVGFFAVKSTVIMIVVNDKIQSSAAEHRLQLVGVALDDLDVDLGITLFEPGNQRGQHISGKQVACSDG